MRADVQRSGRLGVHSPPPHYEPELTSYNEQELHKLAEGHAPRPGSNDKQPRRGKASQHVGWCYRMTCSPE